MTLPRHHNLRGEDNFRKVKEKGKLRHADDFSVNIFKRGDDEVSRFAFVISAKISKLAVHRNRIKRALSESVRRHLKDIPDGYDVIFLPKRSAGSKTTEELMKQADVMLNKPDLF